MSTTATRDATTIQDAPQTRRLLHKHRDVGILGWALSAPSAHARARSEPQGVDRKMDAARESKISSLHVVKRDSQLRPESFIHGAMHVQLEWPVRLRRGIKRLCLRVHSRDDALNTFPPRPS